MITVELPWPSKSLSPNARPHWATKAKSTKDARQAAYYMCRSLYYKAMEDGRFKPLRSSARLQWAFHPKTAHAVDKDNIIASCKAYQDGIAMALGIDDSKFETEYQILEPRKGGLVIVTISPYTL